MEEDSILLVDKYGILKTSEAGKTLLLFVVEVMAIWMLVLILRNWIVFNQTKTGISILVMTIITLSLYFVTVTTREKFFGIYMANLLKQMANVIFFTTVFLVILNYQSEQFPLLDEEESTSGDVFYTNPVKMTYTFVFVYLLCFYFIYNLTK